MSVPHSGPIDLTDRTATVTGAAGGIGRATAAALAREGADVVAADLDAERLAGTAERVRDRGRACRTVECDVTDPDAVDRLYRAAEDFGGVDIAVNSHGIVTRGGVTDESLADWRRVIAVNLTGVFLVAKRFFAGMVERGGGRIVSIGSTVGKTGSPPASAAYCASKGGVHALTKNLARQGADHGVRVNAVAPGIIRTPLTDQGAEFDDEDNPLNRLGEPEDVAETVLYLASQQSNWITGQVLSVNGGTFMG